ncbi:MAG TPA: tetratricopeptide repeat protein [Chloroflexi bacterium]|nr:tetratricopeptide repeat protein [Chloroflexota bacterium]
MTEDTARRAQSATFGYGDYLRFSRLIQERYGLHFPENRRADLERGVRQAFAASTCTDMNEYYRLLLNSDNSAVHLVRLANALTISETHFFRDAGQIDALYYHVLPQIIKRRRELRTLRIWSAGCASGEEPYSIAMLLRELLPDVDEWTITILGTDVNTEALNRARKAIYSEWAFREERAKEWRKRYFRRQGNRYELIEDVKRMVTFDQLNLVEDVYPSYESNTTLMDVILCRNVMIYFTEPISRQIVEHFYDCLTQGGWLVVGHAEHSLSIYRQFRTHNFTNAILYQRDDTGIEKCPSLSAWPPAFPSFFPDTAPKQPADMPSSIPVAPTTPQAVTAPTSLPPQSVVEASTQPEIEGDHVYIDALGRLGHVDPIERAQELLCYGRSEEAKTLLVKLVNAGSKDAQVYALLGQAHANLGEWDQAARWCRQAIRLDKLNLDAYYILALVLQHQEALDEAIDMMKRVVYIDRHNVLGHFGLADLYRSRGQFAQALKSLDNARRLLDGCPDEEVIAGSGGITVGSLREAIIHQQQKWSAEVVER